MSNKFSTYFTNSIGSEITMKLKNYDDLLPVIEQYGFITLGKNPVGMPTYSQLTLDDHWHTGNEYVDPSMWKSKFAREKKGVFIQHLGVYMLMTWECSDLFRSFVKYRTHNYTKEVSYQLLSLKENIIGELEHQQRISIYELKNALKIQNHDENKIFRKALNLLQDEMRITISGAAKRKDSEGNPSGWSGATYSSFDTWCVGAYSPTIYPFEDALKQITKLVVANNPNISEQEILRFLKLRS